MSRLPWWFCEELKPAERTPIQAVRVKAPIVLIVFIMDGFYKSACRARGPGVAMEARGMALPGVVGMAALAWASPSPARRAIAPDGLVVDDKPRTCPAPSPAVDW